MDLNVKDDNLQFKLIKTNTYAPYIATQIQFTSELLDLIKSVPLIF